MFEVWDVLRGVVPEVFSASEASAGVDGDNVGRGDREVGCPNCGGDEWFSCEEGDICRDCGYVRSGGVSERVHEEVEEEEA